MPRKRRYILICTDYVTKWVEAEAFPRATGEVVVGFLYEDIFTQFGIPQEIVTYQGTQFTSKLVQYLTQQYQIKHMISSPYHPQANGNIESTNKVMETILTKKI